MPFFLCVYVFEGLKIFAFCEDIRVSTTVNQRPLLLGSDFLLRFLLVLCTDKCINDTCVNDVPLFGDNSF